MLDVYVEIPTRKLKVSLSEQGFECLSFKEGGTSQSFNKVESLKTGSSILSSKVLEKDVSFDISFLAESKTDFISKESMIHYMFSHDNEMIISRYESEYNNYFFEKPNQISTLVDDNLRFIKKWDLVNQNVVNVVNDGLRGYATISLTTSSSPYGYIGRNYTKLTLDKSSYDSHRKYYTGIVTHNGNKDVDDPSLGYIINIGFRDTVDLNSFEIKNVTTNTSISYVKGKYIRPVSNLYYDGYQYYTMIGSRKTSVLRNTDLGTLDIKSGENEFRFYSNDITEDMVNRNRCIMSFDFKEWVY